MAVQCDSVLRAHSAYSVELCLKMTTIPDMPCVVALTPSRQTCVGAARRYLDAILLPAGAGEGAAGRALASSDTRVAGNARARAAKGVKAAEQPAATGAATATGSAAVANAAEEVLGRPVRLHGLRHDSACARAVAYPQQHNRVAGCFC
jgi:hypothetical protein